MKISRIASIFATASILFFSGERGGAQTMLIPEKPWFNTVEPCPAVPGSIPRPVKLWDSYIWFTDADTSPTPPFCPFRPNQVTPIEPVVVQGVVPNINFNDILIQLPGFRQDGKLVVNGWTIEDIDNTKNILEFKQEASGAGSLQLTNLKASRAASGPDTLNIYWGAIFPGPIPPSGLSVWKIKQSMNNIAKENTLGFASKVDQYGWFQKNFNDKLNPGQIIGFPSTVINVPINTTALTPIKGSRSITQWGGSGPSVAGYRLYARTDLRIHNGFVEFPDSSVIEVLGPPPPPDFSSSLQVVS